MMKENINISPDCVYEELEGIIFILNISTGQYHELDEMGSLIFKKIERSCPNKEELMKELKKEYYDEAIEKDVDIFLQQLKKRGIITNDEI